MTQRETVLAMLRHAGSRGVTGVEFFAANLPRAAARVCELRDRGQEIRSVPYTTGTGVRTVRYVLVPPVPVPDPAVLPVVDEDRLFTPPVPGHHEYGDAA